MTSHLSLWDAALAVPLLAFAVTMSLAWRVPYGEASRRFAHEPGGRLLLGSAVVALATVAPASASALLLVTFFLIADVHLVSTAAQAATARVPGARPTQKVAHTV